MATTKKAGKIRAAAVRDSVAPAASSKAKGKGPAAVPVPVAAPAVSVAVTGPVSDSAAVAPAPVPAPVPGLELAGELWAGSPGAYAFNGVALSSGRWAVAAVALRGDDRRKLLSLEDFTRLHTRSLKAYGLPVEDHPIRYGRAGDEITAALTNMLTARPGTWPARKTDVVVELPGYALDHGFPGSFFRLYVSSDPAAPGVVLLPDFYLVNLGDPAEVWPAVQSGFWTDGQYVATQGTTAAATAEAAAAVRDLVAAIGSS